MKNKDRKPLRLKGATVPREASDPFGVAEEPTGGSRILPPELQPYGYTERLDVGSGRHSGNARVRSHRAVQGGHA